MSVKNEEIAYRRWPRCLRISNRDVDLIILRDAGPRIIRFGFIDDVNEFGELPREAEQNSGIDVDVLGGHRLWHAPEENPRTYQPDNLPVGIQAYDSVETGYSKLLRITQQTEEMTGIRKEIDIALHDEKPCVRLVHRLINENVWAVSLAPWAITVMATEGKAIMPVPPRGPHMENLSPTFSLAVWPYTNLADRRFFFGERFITLEQNPTNNLMQKIGARNTEGWVGYWRAGHLFVIHIQHDHTATYPDLGSSTEVFTNEQILEIETLGPMTRLEPGGKIEHIETWHLHRNVPGFSNEDELREIADLYCRGGSS